MQERTATATPKRRKWCYTIRSVKKDNENMHPLSFGGIYVNEYRIQHKVQDCLGLRV
jgi:GTP cyclohydrolase I